MTNARAGARAVALANGKVLLVGGADAKRSAFAFYTADLYDPVANTWTQTPYSSAAHYLPGVVTLQNGNVLVAGGLVATTTAARAYDPATNTWSAAGSLAQGRYLHGAGLASNGKAVLAGGNTPANVKLSSVEVYSE